MGEDELVPVPEHHRRHDLEIGGVACVRGVSGAARSSACAASEAVWFDDHLHPATERPC